MLDNKKFWAGDTLGFHLRLTWLEDSDEIDFEELNLLLKLDPCDHLNHEKTAKATAKKLMSVVHDTLYLQKFRNQVNITCDYAIFGPIRKELDQLGLKNLENKITVCGSHDSVNLHKNAAKRILMDIENGDIKGKLVIFEYEYVFKNIV